MNAVKGNLLFFNKRKRKRWIGMELGVKRSDHANLESRERKKKKTARGGAWRGGERVGKGQGTRVWSKEDAWTRDESVHVSRPIFYFIVRTPFILSASGRSLPHVTSSRD